MKPALILLHGWGFESTIWQPFIPYLADDFKVIALDLLGFGKNTVDNTTLTLDLLTEDVLTHVPDSAIFLGWSLGGLVAMNIAIHHPKRIKQLITIASTPKFIVDKNWPGMPLMLLQQFLQGLKMDYQATLQQFMLLQFQGGSNDRRLIRTLRQQVMDSPPPSAQALNDGLTMLKDTDLRADLMKIQCRQLYLFGRCDRLVPASIAEPLKSLTHKAAIEIVPKTSHAPFLSNPALCADLIRSSVLS